MPVRILVPTPLRPFTGQQAVVAAEGATVGELLRSLTTRTRSSGRTCSRRRRAPQLRQRLRQRRRHPALEREDTPVGPADTVSIVPSVAGGSAALSNDEVQRYSRHLIIPRSASRVSSA
jgi:adenylyltransferase/sulfurtransferase